MRTAINQLPAAAPVLGASIAGCSWWVVVLAALVTIFLKGADPAMRWLDVVDRLRSRHGQAGDD
jgi:hypothetical protein